MNPRRQQQLEALAESLGLSRGLPIEWSLLDQALTHPSFSTQFNYDRLEFIGDSVVRLVASQLLWKFYPDSPVGDYSAIRSIIVSDRSLAQIAADYNLGKYLLVGGSAEKDKNGELSRLADSLEAILAALYLSTQSLELITPWLEPRLCRLAEETRRDPARQNYKAALQEWTQFHHHVLPEYRVQEISGTRQGDADRFKAEVWLKGQCLGEGKGRSIKTAEQAAAQVAFTTITDKKAI